MKIFQMHHFLQNLYVACKETIKVTGDLSKLDGHRREKTCLRDFRQSEFSATEIS